MEGKRRRLRTRTKEESHQSLGSLPPSPLEDLGPGHLESVGSVPWPFFSPNPVP